MNHEHTLRGGGASEGCRPKLPRWPFRSSSCTQASGTAVHGSMVGSHARRVKLFSAPPRLFGAPRAARLVVTIFPPASWLVHPASLIPAHSTICPYAQPAPSENRVNAGKGNQPAKRARALTYHIDFATGRVTPVRELKIYENKRRTPRRLPRNG